MRTARNRAAERPIWPPRSGAADLLTALGIDLDRDGLRETPARMARAYAELFDPAPLRLTSFDNAESYDELVIARAIPSRWRRQRFTPWAAGIAAISSPIRVVSVPIWADRASIWSSSIRASSA